MTKHFIQVFNYHVFVSYRKEEEQDPDLTVQLDVFDEQKANDDEALPGPQGVDLNSHLDVFHAVFKQVST